MAKKSRRSRRRSTKAKTAQPVRLSRPAAAATVEAKDVDFRQEYHYVIEDLKRIGITAAALLVLLIVLAAFIA